MLGEEERSASSQSHEYNSSGEDFNITEIEDKLEEEEGLEIAMEGEQIVPDFWFAFDELALELTKRGVRSDVQKLMDVVFNVSIDAKELCRHVKRDEDCDCVAIERTHDALSEKRL